MTSGVLAGYPDRRRARPRLVDGSYHDVDSSEMAFKIAGTMGFKEAARKAKPVLLEPIMAVEVVTPEDYMGDVMGDLSSPPRPGRRHGAAGQQPGRPGAGAPVGDVRLRYRPAFADPGSSHLHDAVRLVPADARRASRKRSSRASAASERPSVIRTSPSATAPRRRKDQASPWPRRSSSGTSRT